MIKNPLAIRIILEELEKIHGKKVLYIDLDGVVADFETLAVEKAKELNITKEDFTYGKLYRKKDFYLNLPLMLGAKEALEKLDEKYYIVFLSAPSWGGIDSFSEKRIWIERHFGNKYEKRMDLTFHKGHYMGHYLIDDRAKYGASDFIGEHLMFGDENYPDWDSILKYLL